MSTNDSCTCKPGGDGLPIEPCERCDDRLSESVRSQPATPAAANVSQKRSSSDHIVHALKVAMGFRMALVFFAGMLTGVITYVGGEARRKLEMPHEQSHVEIRIIRIPPRQLYTPEILAFHEVLQQVYFENCSRTSDDVQLTEQKSSFQRGYCFAKMETIPIPEVDDLQDELYRAAVRAAVYDRTRFEMSGR